MNQLQCSVGDVANQGGRVGDCNRRYNLCPPAHLRRGQRWPTRVLLVQRAAHDSNPLTWESPGGGYDDNDASVLHSCARELREETRLQASSIGPLVERPVDELEIAFKGGLGDAEAEWGKRLGGQFFLSSKGKRVFKFYFIVEVENTSEVVIDPNEHVAYIWVTEEEVKREKILGKGEKGDTALRFTSEKQRAVLLEAFKIQKESRE